MTYYQLSISILPGAKKIMSGIKLQFVLVGILILDLIAFTSILPLLPSILSFYEKQTMQDGNYPFMRKCIKLLNSCRTSMGIPNIERYNAVFIGGALGSLFSFLQFICNPIFGAISDVFGRKKTILMTMFGTCISYFLWLRSTSFEVFLLSRIVGGASKCSVTIITAIMSDITDKNQRGRGMAFIGIGFAVAFIIGPLCGAYFTSTIVVASHENPFALPAMFSLCLQAIAIILTIALLPETKRAAGDVTFGKIVNAAIRLINPMRLFTSCKEDSNHTVSPGCGQILLISFMFLVFFSGLEFTLTFLTYQRFGFENRQQGLLFLYVGILMVLVQGGFMRRLKRGNEKKIAASGIFMMIPSMVTLAFAYSLGALCIGLALFSYSAAIVVPCLTTLYSHKTKSSESGEMLGIFRSIGALSRALGPFIVCCLYWTFGSTFCYLIGAVFFCVPLALSYYLDTTDLKTE